MADNAALLKGMLPGLYRKAQEGDTTAAGQIIKIIGQLEALGGTFPASENTPGQAESRAAFELLRRDERVLQAVWWEDYHRLRAEGWDWRKAVYIAWAASPVRTRWPKTQEELATDCLGLLSDRTIRKWKQNEPAMQERIVLMQAEPLMAHRRDVFEALVAVASDPIPQANADRKLFLEMTGDYRPKGNLELSLPPISFIEVAEDGQ